MSILEKKTREIQTETNYSRQVVFEFMGRENEKQKGKERQGETGVREIIKVSYGCKYTDKKRIHDDGCIDSH